MAFGSEISLKSFPARVEGYGHQLRALIEVPCQAPLAMNEGRCGCITWLHTACLVKAVDGLEQASNESTFVLRGLVESFVSRQVKLDTCMNGRQLILLVQYESLGHDSVCDNQMKSCSTAPGIRTMCTYCRKLNFAAKCENEPCPLLQEYLFIY